MRILVLVTDAFGGRGGIAKFNRDFLTALAVHPKVAEVVTLPRRIEETVGGMPPRISYRTEAARGKLAFAASMAAELGPRSHYDMVIAGHMNLLPLAVAFQCLRGGELGLVIHGIEAWQPSRRFFTAPALRRLRWLLSVSRYTEDQFLRWAPVPAATRRIVVPNTVDTAKFAPGLRNRELLDRYGLDGRTVIMTLARLDARERCKGIDETLAALPRLIRHHPTITYLVCGDGTDRARLEAKARSLGLADNRVVFAGYVAEDEKTDHYRLADCFLLTGWCEGFGIALLEAQACGVPVVASVLDGSREAVVDCERSILVDPRDPVELAAGIEMALARPRGIVPPEIERSSFPALERQVQELFEMAV
jgi:phosphatidyl-myo-inositol dimannoside synthase